MTSTTDVIVVGLGAHGSSTASHLARRGIKVIGFDAHRPPHEYGSSHGGSRIIRAAHTETGTYVEMMLRSYELWNDLQIRDGREVIRITGGLSIGDKRGQGIGGLQERAKQFNLPVEILNHDELHERFPVLHPHQYMEGLFDPQSGAIFPENAIQAHLDEAAKAGADLRFEEPVIRWRYNQDTGTVQVTTGQGQFEAAKLVLTAGSWLPKLVADLNLPIWIERQVLFWFEPRANMERFGPNNLGSHSWEYEPGRSFYAQPDYGQGVKIALSHHGGSTNPDRLDRTITKQEENELRAQIERFVPDLNGRLLSSAVCMTTNTADMRFLIDAHPDHQNTLLVSPCSGHGFKFSAVIGEVVADLVETGASMFDLSEFKVDRLMTEESQAKVPVEQRPYSKPN